MRLILALPTRREGEAVVLEVSETGSGVAEAYGGAIAVQAASGGGDLFRVVLPNA